MHNYLKKNQLEYLSRIRKAPDDLIKAMEKFAAEKKIPILDWKAAEFLELLIKVNKPKTVLEIGMAIGYSSIRIARVLPTNGVIHTIEKSKDNLKLAAGYIQSAKLESRIRIHEGDAEDLIPGLKIKFDFIFLDADKEDYEKLFHLSLEKLKRGGIIFIDNLLWHALVACNRIPKKDKRSTQIIREFNKIFLESSLLESTIYPIGDGIGIGIKK